MSTTTEVDVLKPFGKEPDRVIEDSERGEGYDPSLYDPEGVKQAAKQAATDNLGAVAATGLDDEGGQDALDIPKPPEGAKVSFLGVQYDDIQEGMSLGDEVTFLVTGRVSEEGTKVMHDGHQRRFFKVAVDSVKPA